MEAATFRDAMFILIGGMAIFVILTIFVFVVCSATLKKVKEWKVYCDIQFKNITKLVNESNATASELTSLVKQLNNNLKS